MAKKPTPPPSDGDKLVWVTLKDRHPVPGGKIGPGRVKVSPGLRDELQEAGKLAEE